MFRTILTLGAIGLATTSAWATEISGSVSSKCSVYTATAGVYGNPTADELSTKSADGGIDAMVRYDVTLADAYTAKIGWPTEFTTSPNLTDAVNWDGETKYSAGTVTVTTSGAEDGQSVTITLNGSTYTGTVSSNSASVTISAAGLQALTNGQSYTMTADVSDAAGNAASQVTSSSFSVDTTAATMTITCTTSGVTDGSTTNDSSIALTFTSSEATTNFVEGDITVSGGTLSDFAATSSTVYTATFTPSASGATTIDVAADTFTDASGNNNTAATQFNWTYDGTAPTMTITTTFYAFTISHSLLQIPRLCNLHHYLFLHHRRHNDEQYSDCQTFQIEL